MSTPPVWDDRIEMSSPVWQMKESIRIPLPSEATNSLTRRIIVSLGLMWPPMLPTSAMMMDSVIFMSADLLIGSGFELF